LISGLPSDIPVLCYTLQGLLIHEAWIEKNGLNPATFAGQSRATMPVAQRLGQLLAIDPRPLTTARPGNLRALSTCRDFSLMLCGVLRHHGVPARIRCGFSSCVIQAGSTRPSGFSRLYACDSDFYSISANPHPAPDVRKNP